MKAHELDLIQTYIQSRAYSAARELELQPISAACSLMNSLPLNYARRLLVHILPPHAARICRELSDERIVELFDNCDVNRVVAILRCFGKTKRRQLLALMPEKTASLARLLLTYSEDMVGACMRANIFSLPSDILVSQALQRLRLSSYDCDNNRLPVVNRDNRLVGVLNIRALLGAHSESKIEALFDTALSPISSRASIQSTIEHHAWSSNETLFVVNRRRELIGLLRHHDLRSAIQQLSVIHSASPHSSIIKEIALVYFSAMAALFELLLGRGNTHGAKK